MAGFVPQEGVVHELIAAEQFLRLGLGGNDREESHQKESAHSADSFTMMLCVQLAGLGGDVPASNVA